MAELPLNMGGGSHAWLLRGGTAAERAERAAALASAMVCQGKDPPCGECPACKKAAKGIHPDIIYIQREAGRQAIYTKQIRDLAADAAIAPNESERKVYVMPEAGKMVPQAQNAFLKLLEEPPGSVCFILCAAGVGNLLPTVLSRCTMVRLRGGDETVSPAAGPLLTAILTGGETEKLTAALSLEKLDRESLIAALDVLWAGLASAAIEEHSPEKRIWLRSLTALAERLRTLAAASVSAGNIAGLLAVGLLRANEVDQ